MKKHADKIKNREISWSCISSFRYNPVEWAKKYLEDIQTPPNSEMEFGNVIGRKIASDPKFLPAISPRYKVYEKALKSSIGSIKLVSYLDNFDPETYNFDEYKTSSNVKKWTQKSAEEHQQIEFYYLMLWLCYGVTPEKIKVKLWYIPVEKSASFEMKLSNAPIQSFPIQKTTMDILKFGNYIKQTHKEMVKYAQKYRGSI
jgi:hypothetical protein